MNTQLKCLVIEDDPVDFEILENHLRRHGMADGCRRAASRAELRAALDAGGWAVVLSDYNVPGVDLEDTLNLLQTRHPSLPLILVSGTVGEERAVELLKLGVTDFVLKQNLSRLVPAIERSQRDAAGRQARLAAEDRHRSLFDNMLNGCAYCRMIYEAGQPRDFIYLAVNSAFGTLTGLKGVAGRRVSEVIPALRESDPELFELYGRVATTGVPETMEVHVKAMQQWFAIAVYSPAADHFVAVFDVITDRKRAEESLRRSQAVYHSLVSQLPVGIYQKNREGRYVVVNPALCRLHNRAAADFLGKTALEVARTKAAHPGREEPDIEVAREREDHHRHIMESGRPIELEETFYLADGRVVAMHVVKLPVVDVDGQVIGTQGVLFDVTERKRAEEALQRSEEFKQAILDSMAAHIAVLDATGRIVAVNARWQEFARENPAGDGEPQQIIGPGTNYLEICRRSGNHGAQEAHDGIVAVMEGRQECFMLEYPCDSPEEKRWFALEVTRLGAGPQVVISHTNITERRAKTEELRWKTAFLEALVHSSTDGILVVDNKRRKILQNQKLVEFWRLPPEVAANPDEQQQFEYALTQVREPAQLTAHFKQIQLEPDEPARAETELRDGTVLERHSTQVRGQDGQVYGRVWTFRNITHARKLEAQYRQAQKMEAIGTLAGGIAHDFNNILCAIFGYGYLAQQEMAGHPQAQEYLAEILKAGNRAKDLVQQILTFSRQREHKREIIRLGSVVKEAAKFLRASLPSDLRIEVNLDDEAPAVLADPTQIYQVVMNLGTNALHAMEGRPGRLVVTLADFQPDAVFRSAHPEIPANRYTRLTVADDGHGIEARVLEHIFEPFFTTKEVGKGTGLGLAVVHGIVQSHDGFIAVASQPGQGTTFDLFFPAKAAREIPAETPVGTLPRGQGQGILLVDDESALTGPFKGLLERLNYRVTTCNLASEAIRRLQDNAGQFDLVITDLTMPEISGLELARQVHRVRADLPVILATGYAYSLTAATLREAGIVELLEKPLNLMVLAQAVQRALRPAGAAK